MLVERQPIDDDEKVTAEVKIRVPAMLIVAGP